MNRILSTAVIATLGAIALGAGAQSTSNGAAAAQAQKPGPRLVNGVPDLNGTWDNGSGIDFLRPQQHEDGSICITGCAPAAAPATPAASAAPSAPRARPLPDRPKYKPEFAAKVKDLEQRQVEMDPVIRCKSPGLPRIGPPDKIVQMPHEIVFLYDDVSGAFFRIIPLDGRKHRADADESYLGDSVGRWEGDTLVVEAVNFNEDTWLTDDGSFHTNELRVVETLRRTGDTIEWQATAHDPKVLAEPWKVRPRLMTQAKSELLEPVPCVEQDLKHIVDDTHHDNPR
jgi:hypothetical protein